MARQGRAGYLGKAGKRWISFDEFRDEKNNKQVQINKLEKNIEAELVKLKDEIVKLKDKIYDIEERTTFNENRIQNRTNALKKRYIKELNERVDAMEDQVGSNGAVATAAAAAAADAAAHLSRTTSEIKELKKQVDAMRDPFARSIAGAAANAAAIAATAPTPPNVGGGGASSQGRRRCLHAF